MERSPFPAINRELLRFKAFYFFFLSGFGSLLPYLPVYFRQIGLSAHHVGILLGLRPIVQFASAPFWAIMADRYKKRKPILIMSILSWLIMTLALAFVEPTREICEMRVENHTILQFVNYTKIKTGFFKRSVRTLTSGRYTTEVPKLVVLPINLTSLKKIKSRNKMLGNQKLGLDSKNTERNDLHVRQSQLSNQTKKISLSLRGQSPHPLRRSQIASNKTTFLKSKTIRGDSIITSSKKPKGGQQMNTKPVNYDLTMKDGHNFRKKNQPVLHRSLPRFRKHKYHRKSTKFLANSINFKKMDLKTSNMAGEDGKGTGTLKAREHVIKQKRRDDRSSETSSIARNANGNITGVIAFSNEDSTRSLNQSSNDTYTAFDSEKHFIGSGDQDMPEEQQEKVLRSGNASIPKHVKEAAEKLQKQLSKSINFLNNIAKNSSEVLLHHTISMFAKKTDEGVTHTATPKTIPQLSNAINDYIKSNQKYNSSKNLEDSAEGSSVLLSSEHDLSNFAMDHMINNPQHGLNTPDNLHQGDPKQTNQGVIHHNVLPHHVLAFSHNDTTSWPIEEINVQSKEQINTSRPGNGSVESLTSNSLLNFTKVNMSDKNVTDKPQNLNASDSKAVNQTPTEKQSNEQENEFSRENNSSNSEKQMAPSMFSGIVSQVHTTLKNLVKTNKNEMARIFTVLLVLVVVGEFLESPSATLADASLLEVLGENRQFYGKQRLFGSIGFGVCSFIVGILLERSRHVVCGDQYTDYMICFCVFSIMMFLTLLVTTTFDFHYSDSQSSSGKVFLSLCNVHYGSCLVAACVMGIDFSMSHNFLTWFLEDLGASKALMGLAVISRCFADTVTFYFAGAIIKHIGQVHVMIMVMISYTIILLTYSVLRNPWYIIPVEIFDGITYALAWSALTSYLAGAVPAESVTTLQGIVQGVYWGLGTGTGAITGGYLIHHVGIIPTFQLTAGLTFVICLLFSTVQWKWSNTIPNEHPQTKYTYLPTVETKDTDELLSGYYRPGNSTITKTKFQNQY